ncbi:response regulator [Cohnella terricola]|uniref:Response regulator n=1 Tax=Cohnella terricola TaxID=1289167 RepID=A0A559J6J1_9BACL|nr:response regulator [Cohnella terricola]
MYKVLIADDERLDLEGMRRFVPWQDLGLEVVGAVNSGFAALDVMEREKVDILVTDVQMPNMTGLELAGKARDRWAELEVIFVSGYQDFQYAKQAISMNAASYILKPMDDRELIDSLRKITKELDQKRTRRDKEAAYRQMVPMVKNELLLQLLEGSYTNGTLEVLSDQYGLAEIKWPAQVAVLETDDLSWKFSPGTDKDKSSLLSEYSVDIVHYTEERNIPFIMRIAKHRWALILSQAVPSNLLEELISYTKERYPFSITIGLGDSAEEAENVQESYAQALQALDCKMFQGKGKVIDFRDVRFAETEQTENLNVQLDILFEAMAGYELVRIHDEIDGLFRLGVNLKSKWTVHNFAMYIILKLEENLRKQNEDLFKLTGMEFKNLDIIQQFETVDDIRSWFLLRTYEISETLYRKKQNKNWKLIHEVVAFIQKRICESITMREVAEHFNFSPNYLGHLLKKETGKGFAEYVISLRMETAAQLLRDTKLKIYEVAEQVGYRYMPYFSKQFRETFGMTPVEYKRRH